MNEPYGYKISHQAVVNYAKLVSRIIQPMVDLYPYRMTGTQFGDETYIKVRGINKYVFLWSDTTTRIITSYRIYDQRDTLNAVKSIHDVLMHYDEIPDDLVFITDGNPIYNADQLFYHINGTDYAMEF